MELTDITFDEWPLGITCESFEIADRIGKVLGFGLILQRFASDGESHLNNLCRFAQVQRVPLDGVGMINVLDSKEVPDTTEHFRREPTALSELLDPLRQIRDNRLLRVFVAVWRPRNLDSFQPRVGMRGRCAHFVPPRRGLYSSL
jgi:hypothetical protein